MITKKLIPLLMCCISSVYAQQDPLLSQYQFNQMAFNPAYAGVNDVTSFDLHYRSQWRDVDGAPNSLFFSGNTSVFQNKVGLGLSLLHDKIGVTKYTNFNLGGAYAIELNSTAKLSFGLQVGLMSLNTDFNQLTFEDPSDEDFVNASALSKLNFGTGLFLSSENYYIGFSIPQLLNVTEEDVDGNIGDRYNSHIYISGGFIIDHFPSVKLKPYALARITQGVPMSIDFGASALFADILWGGIFTRNFNSIGLSAYLTTANNLRIGYTGELITGSTQPSSGFSTHEISIGIDLELFEHQAAVRRYY